MARWVLAPGFPGGGPRGGVGGVGWSVVGVEREREREGEGEGREGRLHLKAAGE